MNMCKCKERAKMLKKFVRGTTSAQKTTGYITKSVVRDTTGKVQRMLARRRKGI